MHPPPHRRSLAKNSTTETEVHASHSSPTRRRGFLIVRTPFLRALALEEATIADLEAAYSNGSLTGLGASLTFFASTMQWPGPSLLNGYLDKGFPVGLQIVGRAWDDVKIIGYAFACEQATHYRRPPASAPPLGPKL